LDCVFEQQNYLPSITLAQKLSAGKVKNCPGLTAAEKTPQARGTQIRVFYEFIRNGRRQQRPGTGMSLSELLLGLRCLQCLVSDPVPGCPFRNQIWPVLEFQFLFQTRYRDVPFGTLFLPICLSMHCFRPATGMSLSEPINEALKNINMGFRPGTGMSLSEP
jgi:hypothetical protein